ncbi:MAG: sulfate adenylyltransferase [Alphaproteobacteria bacterium]|nr:sulfate adenylyltransferase [Alphaproteobacteria bacterium]
MALGDHSAREAVTGAERDGGVLRFVTAGSVDDGKSTLIGRLLFDSKALLRDQAEAIARSRHARADEGELDLALAVDGLEAEREQGITIDVAYRYFATPRRTFIIADAPGHEQYTRNMVTGASTADLVVVLVDAYRARSGQLLAQTRRHAAIAALMGLDIVVAVNKIDLVDFSETVFAAISASVDRLARALGVTARIVPIAAKAGDNVVDRSTRMPWWTGPTLLELLETTPLRAAKAGAALRFPVQRVVRAGGSTREAYRGYAGRVESGLVAVGDEIEVASSGARAIVAGISTFDGPRTHAGAGRSITVTLDREIDISRGDVLGPPGIRDATAVRLIADVCWLSDAPWAKGRRYILKQGTAKTGAVVTDILFRRDPAADLQEVASPGALAMNDLARVRLTVQKPILADAYEDLPATGGAILIDPYTHQTAAALFLRSAEQDESASEWSI